MRFVLRMAGYILAAVGFVILIIDGLKSIASGALYFSRLADSWQAVHVASLQAVQPLLERIAGHWLWDPAFITLLLAPSSLVLIGLGGLALTVGRSHEGVTIGSPARR